MGTGVTTTIWVIYILQYMDKFCKSASLGHKLHIALISMTKNQSDIAQEECIDAIFIKLKFIGSNKNNCVKG